MEDKIKELETRLEKLEKIENRRKIRNYIVLGIYGVILLTVVVGVLYFYYKIKPYKEKLDNLKDWSSNLKIDNVIDGSDDNYNFGSFDDFFNNFFGY